MRIVRLVFSLEGQLLPVSAGILLPLFVEELLQFACPLQLLVLLGQLNLLLGGWEGRKRRERWRGRERGGYVRMEVSATRALK